MPSDTALTPAELGFTHGGQTVTLYVEAVQPNAMSYWTQTPIKAKLALDGTTFASPDTVNTTVVYSEAGWKQVVYQKSGFNPYIWQPALGYTFNHDDVYAIYDFYDQLYNQSVTAAGNGNVAKFEWPGIAKVAGAQIMNGLALSANGALFASTLQALIAANPAVLRLPNPVSMALLTAQLTNAGPLAAPQILAVQAQTIRGSFGIFNDLAWNYEAYEIGGIKEIQRQAALGTISKLGTPGFDMLQAWESIDSGIPNSIWGGNLAIIQREQLVVLQPLLAPLNGLSVFSVPASLIVTIAGGAYAPFAGSESMLSWEQNTGIYGLFTTAAIRIQYINYLYGLWQQLPFGTRFADVGVALP